MNRAITFDTLQYAKKLKEAGFTEQQAEIQAEALADIIDDKIATKQDILNLESKMRELEYRIVFKLGSVIVIVAGVAVSLIKLI